jgi:site-specific DNA recombinase
MKARAILAQLLLCCNYPYLKRGSLVERKAFIRSFVDEVKVTANEALLNYTIPVSPRKLKEEKTPVLDIVHHGGR